MTRPWRQRSPLARRLEGRDDPLAELPPDVASHVLSGHVVLVGFGRVGQHIAETLDARGLPAVAPVPAANKAPIVWPVRPRGPLKPVESAGPSEPARPGQAPALSDFGGRR